MTDTLPAPLGDDAERAVNWQELFDCADGERLRAGVAADHLFDKARASDQQSERERDTSRAAGSSQRRREKVFQAMALLISRVSASPVIVAELREIAKREAAEAAAREAEANGVSE